MSADEMQAGIELDRLIAEKVMKCDVRNAIPNKYLLPIFVEGEITFKECPFEWHEFKPSTDISAAWAVVEKMREFDFWWSATYQTGLCKEEYNKPDYQVEFRHIKDSYHMGGLAYAETLPLAICRAALKAVMDKEPARG